MTEIEAIDAEEQALSLRHFHADDAWWLGCRLREAALVISAPVAIDIRRAGTRVFSYLLPGATQDNLGWTERKIALVMRFERASYALSLKFAGSAGSFERFGLDRAIYAPACGAVPIRLAGGTVVGAVAVSGLPEAQDHAMVIEALTALRDHQEAAG